MSTHPFDFLRHGVELAARPVVLFDLDGTLTDSREGITRSIAAALADAGADVPSLEELERYIGPPIQRTFEEILGIGVAADRAVAVFRARYQTTGLFEHRPYDGVRRVLESLRRRGRRLFVVTSKPHVFAVRMVEHGGLDGLFEAVHGCELSGIRADKHELLEYVLDRERLDASSCMMVGDREHDVRAAKAHGLFAVGALWGFGTAEELVDAGADLLAETIMDLSQWPAPAGDGSEAGALDAPSAGRRN
jgi:phosphoglycolate phosphatase